MKKFIILLLVIFVSHNLKAQEYEVEPDVETCRPGVLKAETIQKVVDRVNFIRSLHKLSPVEYDHSGSEMSMEGCLNIVASGVGGHVDDPSSACYTPEGGEARMKSNLHQAWGPSPINAPSTSSIDGWMIDNHTSNPEKVGHRRAIINPFLKKFSFGKADGYTKAGNQYFVAMNFLYQDYVTGGTQDDVDFIAYPFENYPPELVDKSFYLSFSAIYNRSGAFANGEVDYSKTSISVSDENGNNMNVHSIESDLEGWGSLPNNIAFKVNNLQNDIKYDVTVNNVVINGQSNDYTYWFRLTDVISTEPPATPLLVTPEDEKTDASITQSFYWEKAQFASNYHIQIATDDEFNNIFEESEDLGSVSYAPDNTFEYETEYFWRIKAKNQNGESEWSEIWSFTTGKAAPDEMTIVYPEDGAVNISVTPVLEWMEDPNAESYKLEIWDNIDMMGWPQISENSLQDTTYKVSKDDALETETEYFWRVRAVNNSGNGPWTDLFSFITDDGSSVVYHNSEIGLKISPNPFAEECFITFNTEKAQKTQLEIFDISGKNVYKMDMGYTGAGENTIMYNTKEKSGVYFIKLTIGNKIYQEKIIIKK